MLYNIKEGVINTLLECMTPGHVYPLRGAPTVPLTLSARSTAIVEV